MYKDAFEILLFCKETFLCKEGHLLGKKAGENAECECFSQRKANKEKSNITM